MLKTTHVCDYKDCGAEDAEPFVAYTNFQYDGIRRVMYNHADIDLCPKHQRELLSRYLVQDGKLALEMLGLKEGVPK